jgi:hypothetical protein
VSGGEPLVHGLADRLRTLLLAMDRLDRLETAGELAGWLGRERDAGHLPAHARELFLRSLRVAADPANFGILAVLDPLEAVDLTELMQRTGLARVAASERVNDLVQVGLAVREMVGDQIRCTPLAEGVVALVESVAGETGERLWRELGAAEAESGG